MYTTFKSIFVVALVLGMAGTAIAQTAPAPTGKEAVNALLIRKEQFLKSKMSLSDLEHEKFIGMYLTYMEEILLMDDSRTQLQKSLIRSAEFATEQELSILSGNLLEIDRQKVEEKQGFYDELVVNFGIRKATLWLQAELQFQKELMRLYGESRSLR